VSIPLDVPPRRGSRARPPRGITVGGVTPTQLPPGQHSHAATARLSRRPLHNHGDAPRPTHISRLSAVPGDLMQTWWEANPANFTHVFRVFARALERGFAFADCDPLANFASRAVAITQDRDILREAIRGLALLGSNHNRWHVRDVAVGILQGIRDDAHAASALEGLEMAGPSAAEWTAGHMLLGTLHPILRTGIPQISPPEPMAGAELPQGSWT
jgi:hypothetical protein